MKYQSKGVRFKIIELTLVMLMCTLIYSCKTYSIQADPVVGGVPTKEFPSVVRMEMYSTTKESNGAIREITVGDCSAFIVSSNTIITSAHCVEPILNDPAYSNRVFQVRVWNNQTIFRDKNVVSSVVRYNPKYSSGFETPEQLSKAQYDIAVAVFNSNPFQGITPLSIDLSQVTPNLPVRLVGYGCDTAASRIREEEIEIIAEVYGISPDEVRGKRKIYCAKDKEIKKTGTSQVADKSLYCASNMIEIRQYQPFHPDSEINNPNGVDVMVNSGDSGSPLIKESDHSKALGVASYLDRIYSDKAEEGMRACFTPFRNSENITFLKQMIQQYHANISGLSM